MSEKNFERFTVTAALPYANGPIHIGHLAGVYVPADIYVRYLRQKGEDVLFVCGSDEHGAAITLRAKKEKTTPQAIVDKYHTMIEKSFQDFGISFDVYSRTSKKIHHETAQEYFQELHAKNIFTQKTTDQFYDPQEKQFLADRYIIGTCPVCDFPEAYGDQCENCGSTLSPEQLINPRSRLSNATPIKKQTSHWFLPLDKYENWLQQWILEEHSDWKKNVLGQCKSWLDNGLQPRAMTRDLDWGIPVPLENAEGKVMYVWFDAPIGYISATKEYFQEKNDSESWKKYWQDEQTKLVHFIGKDNIVFHCIIFPTLLKVHGDYILPENVPANEFMNLESQKISTSRNRAVWLHEYLEDFSDKQDVLRYALASILPETSDSDFTWKDFQTKNNSELVGILGNFFNRCIVLTHKYFDGVIPPQNKLEKVDEEMITTLEAAPAKIGKAIEEYRFREAIQELMNVARLGNKYFQDTEPWILYKEKEKNQARIETVLNLSLQIAANLAFLSKPFLPFSAEKMQKMLNLSNTNLAWQYLGKVDLLQAGNSVQKQELLFAKVEDKEVETQMEKLAKTLAQKQQAQAEEESKISKVDPVKEEIQFDDFLKLDIRTATITAAEKIKKADKLLKITLDTGIDERTVVSGIAQHYSPEEIVGQQVSVILNLAPRKMKGVLSQGMILMAEDTNGKLVFVSPKESIGNGSEVR